MNGEGKDALMNLKTHHIIAAIFVVLASCPAWAGEIIYVDDDAALGGDGLSWETAYCFLQDGLADAEDANKPVEIRVAHGIYKPDLGSGQIKGDRFASFDLISRVTLKGGYAGSDGFGSDGRLDSSARDFEKFETILSGDLGGNDV